MKKGLKCPAPGKLVNVNGHDMHIFSEGQGDKTFVFMAGHGTACPTLDFKPMWSLLINKYKIAVVEKFGYGWSEITKRPRDLDTILTNTREALKLAGVDAPYVLVPHSLSGLEAIYWAQKYPQEVKAIIGLDPSVPDIADYMKLSLPLKLAIKLMAVLSRMGMSESAAVKALKQNFPSFESTALTESDKTAFVEVFQRRTLTPDMLREMKDMPGNVKKIRELPLPSDVPVCFFSSDFREAKKQGRNPDELLKFHRDFLACFKTSKHLELNCGHYVHSYEAEKIVDEMTSFVDCVV